MLYLGEINDSQHTAWSRVIKAFDEESQRPRQLALFPAGRDVPDHAAGFGVQVRLDAMELHRPRQWGACWLACHLYEQLELDRFWTPRLPNSREGTRWRHILQTLVCYRLIDPGSEWRLHRLWFEQSAMADLLGEDYSLVEKNALYRCLDKLLAHKAALFDHLRARWQDLFGAKFEVLLYDLTSTYFESDPPDNDADKRRHGCSRDKRSDCVQVVIALIVTPEGLPLAYEVLPGNTADNATLRGFLEKIEAQYGKARASSPSIPTCVNSATQFAGIAALQGPQDSVAGMRAEFDRRRTAVVAGLNSLPGVSAVTPKGAFYAFSNVSRTGWKAKPLAPRPCSRKRGWRRSAAPISAFTGRVICASPTPTRSRTSSARSSACAHHIGWTFTSLTRQHHGRTHPGIAGGCSAYASYVLASRAQPWPMSFSTGRRMDGQRSEIDRPVSALAPAPAGSAAAGIHWRPPYGPC